MHNTDPESLHKTIYKAWALRNKYINHSATNAYRLVNSYGDALPEITIDVYNKNLLVQYYHSYEKHLKESICNTLNDILTPESITEKTRLKGEVIKTRLVSGNKIPGDFTVMENGIKFCISLLEGGGTGLFLDQRDNRKKIQSLARGKEVLNCFCYTSSFSVYAIIGNAVRTINIDLSKKAIEWSKKNYLLNQLDINNHEFIVGDVWEWLRKFQKKGRSFDVIIIDPPTFSTSKTNIFTAEKDIPRLVGGGLNILREDGILAFSTNISKVKFSKFFQLLSQVKDFSHRKYKIIDVSSQGNDFPTDGQHATEPYLKFVLLTC